jgi:glycerol kinase
LKVDGGAVRDDLLMQMQADFLGVSVQRPSQTESTVLGAAFLAGLGVGYWSGLPEIRKVWSMEREFKPELKSGERRRKLEAWHRAVERVRET